MVWSSIQGQAVQMVTDSSRLPRLKRFRFQLAAPVADPQLRAVPCSRHRWWQGITQLPADPERLAGYCDRSGGPTAAGKI